MRLEPGLAPLMIALSACAGHPGVAPTAQVRLGETLFFSDELSLEHDQSCAVCHGREVGWTGPDEALNVHGAVYEGSVDGRFGNRKPPTSAYASFAPVLHVDPDLGFVGGNFWDGRATGERLGTPVADQAQGPPLNPLEQAMPDAAAVVARICAPSSPLRHQFVRVWGEATCDDTDAAWEAVARSIAAFEASKEMSPFSSEYDAVLAGRATLSAEEELGLTLFEGKAGCSTCHATTPGAHGDKPLFTNFAYENLGIPANPENPFYAMPEAFNPDGADWVDPGLGGFLQTRPEWADQAEENLGKFKVPTLRNVDARPEPGFVKAYGHNGYFKSLAEIVHFYNTRDVLPRCPHGSEGEKVTCWPRPELEANLNTTELGDLGLTPEEEAAIVAFLQTLTDGWEPGP